MKRLACFYIALALGIILLPRIIYSQIDPVGPGPRPRPSPTISPHAPPPAGESGPTLPEKQSEPLFKNGQFEILKEAPKPASPPSPNSEKKGDR